MATSGQIGGRMTAQGMIIAAMQDLGAISGGEVPAAEDTEMAMTRLNWLLKSMQTMGCNLWRDTEGTVQFPGGTATVTLDPTVVDVLDVRAVHTGGSERWLTRWEPGEYRRIPMKSAPGTPSAYVVEKTRDAVKLTLWPVPVANIDIIYNYARVVEDVTDPMQDVDVPQEWTEAVWKMLAARLIAPLGSDLVDPATAARVTAEASALADRMMTHDRPASIYMGSVVRRNVRR